MTINFRLGVEGRFHNGKKTYEYFLSPYLSRVMLNVLDNDGYYPWKSISEVKDFHSYMVDHFGITALIKTPYDNQAVFYIESVFVDQLEGIITDKSLNSKAEKEIDTLREGMCPSVPREWFVPASDDQVKFWFRSFYEKNRSSLEMAATKNNNQPIGGNKNMTNTNKAFNIPGLKNVGKQLNNVFAFSIITNKMAIKMGDSFFSFDKDTKQITDETSFAMEVPFPAMIFPEKMSKLKSGDLVIRDNKIVFVVDVDKEGKTYTYIGPEGKIETAAKVSNALIKEMDFVEKVVNPLADTFDSSEDDGLFDNPMMMMALMSNGGNIFGGENSGNNDMMSMLMLSKMMKK